MTLSNEFVEAFKKSREDDNQQFMAEEITHDEYWGRVHKRDDQVKNMTPEERLQVNS